MSSTAVHKDLKLHPGSTVCSESELKGVIEVGSKTVIHPKASIFAESGPIIIGESNLFEEQCVVRNINTDESKKEGSVLNIGSNNVFEVGATVLAKVIGDSNVFESKCYVGPNIEVGSGCTVGAGVTLTVPERLPDNIIITGSNCDRRIARDKPPLQMWQLEYLSKVLPNYHYIKKPK